MGNQLTIGGLKLVPLKIINTQGGDVLHAIKKGDDGFVAFSEAYFSTILYNEIKGWKKHSKMSCNLIVPHGKVKFVMFDDRSVSETYGQYNNVVLHRENYYRLTIPPNIWFAFQGLYDKESIILNIADIIHNPCESLSCQLDTFNLKFFY